MKYLLLLSTFAAVRAAVHTCTDGVCDIINNSENPITKCEDIGMESLDLVECGQYYADNWQNAGLTFSTWAGGTWTSYPGGCSWRTSDTQAQFNNDISENDDITNLKLFVGDLICKAAVVTVEEEDACEGSDAEAYINAGCCASCDGSDAE